MEDRFKFRYALNNKVYDVIEIDFYRNALYIHIGDCSRQEIKPINYKNLIQCKGSKDKNGTLIYEGDILKNTLYAQNSKNKKDYLCIVKYEVFRGGFTLEYLNGIPHNVDDIEDDICEIIGNIHENPELLEAV